MRVAILHDWITGMRGGERCLEVFLAMYPSADIFTLLHIPGTTSPEIDRRVRGTSFLQRLPGAKRFYRWALPLYPFAARSLKLDGYDLIISISHAAVKNARIPAGAIHLCYCLTPMRYVWDQAWTYFGKATPLFWPVLRWLRSWDRAGGSSVARFVPISRFVLARLRCFYPRATQAKPIVVYPPIDPYWFSEPRAEGLGEAFLYAGALVPYKRADAVIESCTRLGLPLWVAGEGPELQKLQSLAGPSVKFLGKVSDSELRSLYRRARALIFPAREDFGMIPLECMAAGRPVIALYAGASRETVRGIKSWEYAPDHQVEATTLAAISPTGVFIAPRASSLQQGLEHALRVFVANEGFFSGAGCLGECRRWAERFSLRRFVREWQQIPEASGPQQQTEALIDQGQTGKPSTEQSPTGQTLTGQAQVTSYA